METCKPELQNYERRILSISAVIENAPYLLTGKYYCGGGRGGNSSHSNSGVTYYCGGRGSNSSHSNSGTGGKGASSSNIQIVSPVPLESSIKDLESRV